MGAPSVTGVTMGCVFSKQEVKDENPDNKGLHTMLEGAIFVMEKPNIKWTDVAQGGSHPSSHGHQVSPLIHWHL